MTKSLVHYSSSYMSQDTHLKQIQMNNNYDMKTAVTTITVYKMQMQKCSFKAKNHSMKLSEKIRIKTLTKIRLKLKLTSTD